MLLYFGFSIFYGAPYKMDVFILHHLCFHLQFTIPCGGPRNPWWESACKLSFSNTYLRTDSSKSPFSLFKEQSNLIYHFQYPLCPSRSLLSWKGPKFLPSSSFKGPISGMIKRPSLQCTVMRSVHWTVHSDIALPFFMVFMALWPKRGVKKGIIWL